jgi:hypothetical protein
MKKNNTIEEQRLAKQKEDKLPTASWGPYLSERQCGTVREDYSKDGNAWEYFPHEHARSYRPMYGKHNDFYRRPENKDLILFYEYFHGETGIGLGASHQTGWTGLIAALIQEMNEEDKMNK